MNLDLNKAIVNSALWAAAGDALGWITELADTRGVRRRIGGDVLHEPVEWKRSIGGIRGAQVTLPAGTYSDDTQLRLAVCRAIQGDGNFDIELFAKVELPVWSAYALGAGRGSKAAAASLAKRDVNWFSNFFSYGEGRSYVQGGGNGAAMRVQPHVWRRARSDDRSYLLDVVRDSLTTHGHMLGLCGAVFHADCLSFALRTGEIPGPEEWMRFVNGWADIEGVIRNDYQLGRFWLGAWEEASKSDIASAIAAVAEETQQYIVQLRELAPNWGQTYRTCIEILDGFGRRQGTGTNTALAAAFLAWTGQDARLEDVLVCAANTIGSDTDTIGTMAGALLGVLAPDAPSWQIQDREYLIAEARRMAKIAQGERCESFTYPDLISWQAPATQGDAVGEVQGRPALMGLGYLEPLGKSWRSGDFAYEWFRLEFGQSVLCKRRAETLSPLDERLVPSQKSGMRVTTTAPNGHLSTAHVREREIAPAPVRAERAATNQPQAGRGQRGQPMSDLFGDDAPRPQSPSREGQPAFVGRTARRDLDTLTDLAIRSNFDPTMVGELFLQCLDAEDGIERGMVFSGIVAKAFLARKRRRN